MHRRALVSLLLATLVTAISMPARADLIAPPPPALDVRPHATTHAGPGAPTSAQWEIHNRGAEAVTIELVRTVLLLPRMRLPLRMNGARIAGQPAPREITIAPGGTVIVEVALTDFSGPAEREASWELELRVQVRGAGGQSGSVSGTTRVTRARTASR